MIQKLMNDLCRQSKLETKAMLASKNFKKNPKIINLEYADTMCQKLFSYRQDDRFESRIKFKIQDLIDAYNKEWRFVISEARSRVQDIEGFKKVYIPKD